MVEINIKINQRHRLVYLPKLVASQLGPDATIRPDSRSAILYRTGEDPELVAQSIELLVQELRLFSKTKPASQK